MLGMRPCPGDPPVYRINAETDDWRTRLAQALASAGEGNCIAFRLVYILTHAKLFSICIRICGERAGAEDVLAEVYLTVWNRADTWNEAQGSAMGWLATIARNRAVDWRRALAKRGIEVSCDTYDTADNAPNAEAALLADESNAQLHRCLDALLPNQQSAIRAAFFEGYTYAELASQRGVPLGTMKSWVRRGLSQMRRDMLCDDETFGRAAAFPITRPNATDKKSRSTLPVINT